MVLDPKLDRDMQEWARRGVEQLQFVVLDAAPAKPRKGLLVYADGSTWNPGSGQGLYRYTGSAWVFVG